MTTERPVEDRLCDKVADRVYEWLCEQLQFSQYHYEVNGIRPVLRFSRDPDMWPLYVDLGAKRYMVECEVMVTEIDPGGPQDGSLDEESV